MASYVRVHKYQAISNPMYICFLCMEYHSVDPVYEALELITQMKKVTNNKWQILTPNPKTARFHFRFG